MLTTTYKELYDRVIKTGKVLDDEYFTCEEELYVDTPTGFQQIRGVFKKSGAGLRLSVDGGFDIDVEKRHTVMTSTGWQYAEDAIDIKHRDGTFRSIVSKTHIDDDVFYDIGIDAPHAYFDTDGFIHHNTYTIMQAIQAAGLTKGKDYVKLSGKASAIEIYKTLFMFRKNGLVLFDDLDSMWKDKDASNYLKAALDTSPVREISSLSRDMMNVSKMSDSEREEYNDAFDKFLENNDTGEEDIEDEEDEDGKKKKAKKSTKMKFPSTFDFKGRVVFISNLKKDEFDSAIMSRSAKIDMSLTAEETLSRMRSILPTLGGTDVSVEIKEELIQVLLDLHKSKIIEVVTMREFIKSLDIVRSGAPNWKELVVYS